MESCVLCCCCQDAVESFVPQNSHSDYYSLESLGTQTEDIIPPSSATRVSEQRTENRHEQDKSGGLKNNPTHFVLPGEVHVDPVRPSYKRSEHKARTNITSADEDIAEKKNKTKKPVSLKKIQSFLKRTLNAMTQPLLCSNVDTVSITESLEENCSDSTKNLIPEELSDWISDGYSDSQSISMTNRGFEESVVEVN